MQHPSERLVEIRRIRFAKASEAARAIGVPEPTYLGHENGSRGLSRSAPRYAEFFRVSLDWLMTGRGTMRGGRQTIPVVGRVGAGATVLPITDDTSGVGIGEIEFPEGEYLAALEVEGESQYPRYIHGEVVVYDGRPLGPGQMANRYAVVDLADGRRLLKMIRRMPSPGEYRLESHNAPPLDNADIVAAYRIEATLAHR